MVRGLLIVVLLLIWPGWAAAVSISEVAWMGDATSANFEWIELYNGGESVTVDGWILRDGMNLTITLTGTIPANSYVLLMRNRTSGVYPGGVPFLVYTGALVNTGATLTIQNASGVIIDQVAGGENWQNIGGDNTTKETAQYTAAGWRTGTPTPGTEASVIVTPPPTTGTSTPTSTPPVTTPTTTTISTSGGNKKSDTVKIVRQPNDLQLQPDIQKVAYVNQPIPFGVRVTGVGTTTRNSLKYHWNFGDLRTSSSSKPIHAYRYPGTYVVMVEVAFGQQRQMVRHDITVLPVTLTIGRSPADDIYIHNDAPYDIDLSAYRLVGATARDFPLYTIIPAKSTLTVARQSVGVSYGSKITLYDRLEVPVAVWPTPVAPAPVIARTPFVSAVNEVLAVSDPDTAVAPPSEPTAVAATTPILDIESDMLSLSTTTPLLILAPVASTISDEGIPAYVYLAFSTTTTKNNHNDGVVWPYIALVIVLTLAIGSIVASSSNVSSRLPKISPDA